jgi:hypothetical protein
MMATQARGGKPKNPMPTVIVVEGHVQIPQPRQILRRACRTSHESPLFATLLDSALVAIDAK